MQKKVLITGAYGFLGRYIAKAFQNKQWTVIGMGHGKWNDEFANRWGISTWQSGDISLSMLQKYANGVELIVHCAGSGSVAASMQNPMRDFERTVGSIQAVLEYIRLEKLRTGKDIRLIYPSSAAVYGEANDLPIQEKSLLQPVSVYGMHKKIAEELCTLYGRQYHVAGIIVRLFSVYGNGLQKQLLWDACQKYVQNDILEFFGDGTEQRDWVHVEDVASLFLVAARYASIDVPVVNCGSGQSVAIKEVIQVLIAAFPVAKHYRFNGKINVGNPRNYLADNSQVKSWGWHPTIDLRTGIREYVEWYLEYGKI